MGDSTPDTTTAENRTAKKRKLSVRMTERGYDVIADLAAKADISVGHQARRMFAYYVDHLPDSSRYVPRRGRRSTTV